MELDDQPLERHPSLDDRVDPAIRILAHDPEWALRAQSEISRISRGLGELVVGLEHVGSTAVPGLAAKAVIDLQLSVAEIADRARFLEPLSDLGYLFIADPGSPEYHFFARPHTRPRSYHLHVCETGSCHEARHLAVREFLREDPLEAARYAALKRSLVAQHPQDRLAYIAGKAEYMDDLEARALARASRPPVRGGG